MARDAELDRLHAAQQRAFERKQEKRTAYNRVRGSGDLLCVIR